MLFSQDKVAAFINQYYEPAWEMVRPVPMVHIDFGNCTALTRTLHGNILTSVCNADGMVLDALPGIYLEKTYLTDSINYGFWRPMCRPSPPSSARMSSWPITRRRPGACQQGHSGALRRETRDCADWQNGN